MLAGKQWFYTLDLASGYWSQVKKAFATHSGLFQFRVMLFGLCNAPATMDRVLQGLRWNRCLVYLDDIISFGSTFDGALTKLTLIFERLLSYGSQLKSTKCHLVRSSVPFLGNIVGRHGLECNPAKIEDVKSWPVPDCPKSVRQFLGFVGYYRRFIPNFADVTTSLMTLTGKNVPFVWDLSCSTAFAALRAAMMDAPILAFTTETGLYVSDRLSRHTVAVICSWPSPTTTFASPVNIWQSSSFTWTTMPPTKPIAPQLTTTTFH